ncbi:MAG: hypothetical protein R3290_07485 [Acidimicrobiia bacterium]|nr:hypothetical protein [Acidimicrobiia bacterium]
MKKLIRTLKTGLVAALVGAVVVSGVAIAQTDAPSDAITESPAYARIAEALEPLVEDGTITEAQAGAVAEHLAENAPGHRGKRGGLRHAVQTASEFLGMEVEDLVTQLRDGSTLAEIAGDQTDELIDELVAQASERLDEAVENGRLTQEEADEKLAEITERITDMVNGEVDFDARRRGPRRGGPGGPGGPGGGEGFQPPAEDAGFPGVNV